MKPLLKTRLGKLHMIASVGKPDVGCSGTNIMIHILQIDIRSPNLRETTIHLRVSGLRIPLYLWRGEDDAEGGEGVVEELLVDLGVEVADEDVRAHVQVLLVRRGLVHPINEIQNIALLGKNSFQSMWACCS